MGEHVRDEKESDSSQGLADILRAERVRQDPHAGKCRLRRIAHSIPGHLIVICTSGVIPAFQGDHRTITSVYVPLAATV